MQALFSDVSSPFLLLRPWSNLNCFKKLDEGTSLLVQWLRIHLPMQGIQVRALVWEDPTCRRAAKPMHHNYWACALEPVCHNYWAHVPQLLSPRATTTEAHTPKARAPQQAKLLQWEACTPQQGVAPGHCNYRKPTHSNEAPRQPKINKFFLKLLKKKKKMNKEDLNWSCSLLTHSRLQVLEEETSPRLFLSLRGLEECLTFTGFSKSSKQSCLHHHPTWVLLYITRVTLLKCQVVISFA